MRESVFFFLYVCRPNLEPFFKKFGKLCKTLIKWNATKSQSSLTSSRIHFVSINLSDFCKTMLVLNFMPTTLGWVWCIRGLGKSCIDEKTFHAWSIVQQLKNNLSQCATVKILHSISILFLGDGSVSFSFFFHLRWLCVVRLQT